MDDPQSQTNQVNTDQPIDPGSLDYVPKAPEAPPTPLAPEIQKPIEIPSIAPITSQAEPQPSVDTVSTIAESPTSTIVDKTYEAPELHDIPNPLDKTTEFADTEEEELIEGVRAAHGSE